MKRRNLFLAVCLTLSWIFGAYLLTSRKGIYLRLDSTNPSWLDSAYTFLNHYQFDKNRSNRILIGSSQTRHGFIPNLNQDFISNEYNLSAIGGTILHSWLMYRHFVKDRPFNLVLFEISPRMFNSKNEKNNYALRYLTTFSDFLDLIPILDFDQKKTLLLSLLRSSEWTPNFDLDRHASQPSYENGSNFRPEDVEKTPAHTFKYSSFLETVYRTESEKYTSQGLAAAILDKILAEIKSGKNIAFFQYPLTSEIRKIYSPELLTEYESKIRGRIRLEGGRIFDLPEIEPGETNPYYADQIHPTALGAARFTEDLKKYVIPEALALNAIRTPKMSEVAEAICGGTEYWEASYRRQLISPDESTAGEILLLGDSITDQMSAIRFWDPSITLNRGVTADTIHGLELRLNSLMVNRLRIKAIVLLIGINDILNCEHSVGQVASDHLRLIERIKQEFPNSKIYIQEILPIGDQAPSYFDDRKHIPFSDAQKLIFELNQLLHEQYQGQDRIRILSAYNKLLEKGTKALDKSYTTDGLHLNDRGYSILIDEIRNQVPELVDKIPMPPPHLDLTSDARVFPLIPNNPATNSPLQMTQVEVTQKSGSLEISFQVNDSDDQPFGTKNGDSLWNGDLVAVYLQPDIEKPDYMELEVNSRGIRFENLVNSNNENHSLQIESIKGVQNQVKRISNASWSAHWSIPINWKKRRIRMNFYRIDFNSGHPAFLSSWSPTYTQTFHVPLRFGEVTLAD